MQENSKKIVFLDRDGTISADSGYTAKPCDMHILPKSGKGIALLKQAGFKVVVVTNQSAIGRGFASVEDVMATNRECQLQLEAEDNNAFVDQVLFCPHKPEDNCHCRKPKTGMIDFLNPPYNFDVKSCWMVGDKISDLDFGSNLGIPHSNCILVKTGEGEKELLKVKNNSFPVIEDLYLACKHIVSNEGEN